MIVNKTTCARAFQVACVFDRGNVILPAHDDVAWGCLMSGSLDTVGHPIGRLGGDGAYRTAAFTLSGVTGFLRDRMLR